MTSNPPRRTNESVFDRLYRKTTVASRASQYEKTEPSPSFRNERATTPMTTKATTMMTKMKSAGTQTAQPLSRSIKTQTIIPTSTVAIQTNTPSYSTTTTQTEIKIFRSTTTQTNNPTYKNTATQTSRNFETMTAENPTINTITTVPYSARYWRLTFTYSHDNTNTKLPLTGLSFGATLQELEQGAITERMAAHAMISALLQRDCNHSKQVRERQRQRQNWDYEPSTLEEINTAMTTTTTRNGNSGVHMENPQEMEHDTTTSKTKRFRAQQQATWNGRHATAQGNVCFEPHCGEICVEDYRYECRRV